ncbi:glycosyltransferase [Pararhizobium sp. O133]|uniref:glycosyltransferase n=1 Tax=Pararhizobium sp. O133 TaxID=3449278 RepID=UPI003F6893F6
MIKSTLIYLPAYILPRVAALVVILFGTRLLTPSEFGYFSLTILIGEFADTVLTNWARIGIARFGVQSGGVSRPFVIRMAWLMSGTTIVALAASVAISWGLAPERAWEVGLAVCCYVASAAFLRFGIRLNQIAERTKTASSLEALRAAIYLALTLGVMTLRPDSFLDASLAGCISGVVVGIIACRQGIAHARPDLPDTVDWKVVIAFSWPLVTLTLLGQLVSSLDKATLKAVHDAATLGIYTAAFTVGRAAFDVVGASFNTGAFVRLSALFNEGKTEKAQNLLSQQLALILSVFLPGAAVLIISVELIATVLFKPEFLPTFLTVTPLVVVGAMAINIKFFVYDNIYHMFLRNIRQIPTLVIGSAVSVVVGFLVVPVFPEYGAALMFASGSLASLAMSILLSYKLMRVPLPVSSILTSTLLAIFAFVVIWFLKVHILYAAPALAALICLCMVGVVFIGASLFLCHRSMKRIHAERTASPRRRYAFLANSMKHGGIERVVLALCNGMQERDVDITLILRMKTGQYVEDLHPRLKVIELGHASMARGFPKLLWLLLREQFDVVVCGGDQQAIAAALVNLVPFQRTRYVITEHSNPILNDKATKTIKTKVARLFRSWLFPRVAHIITVSGGLRAPLIQSFGCDPDRTTTIYNPIPVAQIQEKAAAPVQHRWLAQHDMPVILSVGRLDIAKNFIGLIEAFAIVRKTRDARLLIVGDGPERDSLEKKAAGLGLGHDIDLPGFSENPYSYMSKADIFVLSSQWEGFAIVVAEALACGQKVVATDCPSGPAEILDGGRYGRLVPVADPQCMAEAIIEVLDEDSDKAALQARAAEFSVDIAVDRYLALMERISK